MASLVAAIGIVAACQGDLMAQDALPTSDRIRVPDGLASLAVSRAIHGAARRLDGVDCQRVLTDFRDADGRTLRENLDATGRLPGQFVTDLWYIDAGRGRSCAHSDVSAFTTPGARVIYVCGIRFAAPTSSLSGRFGEVVIIHETLHALGLGENGPNPTTAEITRQVLRRCGR